jgi:flavin-dependent dehydrogenase
MPAKSELPVSDLLIVGAGPAGLACAIEARLAGLSVIAIERRSPELDKACGEGLMPPAVRALERLGISLPAWGCHRFAGVRYLEGRRVAEGRFSRGYGLGVRRVALSEALRRRAEQLGVVLRFGMRLERWERAQTNRVVAIARATSATGGCSGQEERFEGRLLVGADGLHSKVRAAAGLPARQVGSRRFGVRRHIAMAPWSDFVEVYWAHGVEAYVTPVGPELIGVALLWDERKALKRAAGADVFARLLAGSFPQLAARIGEHPYASDPRGAGPFHQKVRRCYADRVVLVGDAAGYVDPLTGEGVSLALSSARLLVDAVRNERDLASYERRYRRLYRQYAAMAGLALGLASRPWLRRRALALLGRFPSLFSYLLGRGQRPHWQLERLSDAR